MLWLKTYTDKIRAHLSAGDAASLTYAALEARLALEQICYERLRIAHKYISTDDIKTWKPQHVVRVVVEMVDSQITNEWTLSIGSEPGENPPEYLKVGTQKGFDPKYIGQLWQAMSSFLHAGLPRNATTTLEHYKDKEKLKPKIEETLRELDRIAEGTLVGSMVFEQVSFDCVCGQKNSRSVAALKQDDIINCINEGCKEQYRVEKSENDFLFERRLIPVACHQCQTKNGLPHREINEMDKLSQGRFYCSQCEAENIFMWRLMQLKKKDEPTS